jgi:hypothetical protein
MNTDMKKQTALEWLEKEIRKQLHVDIKHTTIGVKLFEEAKAMEKEQIESAYTKGRIDEITTMDDLYFNPSWEKYYNETYGGDK